MHIGTSGIFLWDASLAHSSFVLSCPGHPDLCCSLAALPWPSRLAVAALLPIQTLSLELYLAPLEMTSVTRKLLLR